MIDLCEELHDDVENLASIDENTHVPPGDTAGTVVYSTESIFARNTSKYILYVKNIWIFKM